MNTTNPSRILSGKRAYVIRKAAMTISRLMDANFVAPISRYKY